MNLISFSFCHTRKQKFLATYTLHFQELPRVLGLLFIFVLYLCWISVDWVFLCCLTISGNSNEPSILQTHVFFLFQEVKWFYCSN